MARKIRLGNDIDITWSLLDKDENPYIVEGRDFEIEVVVGTRKYRMYDVSASGNQIHFVFYGKDQRTLGNATLVYIENGGRVDMVTFDTKDAFEMVPHSWLAVDSDEHPETVTLDVVTVLSNLASSIGPRGYSAYEIARQHGYTGTEEEWLDSLKPHITADAEGNVYCDGVLLTDVIYRVVSAVTADEQERQEAETARRTAEDARVEAETARQTAESARAEAETARQTAENARAEAETARQTAESGRQTAETQRGENETTRQSQETARQNAETQRGENETTRQSQETARVNAEQNRTTEFNGLKSNMQTAIQQMGSATATVIETNTRITENETARQQAESGRVAAENARQSAEQTRGQNEQTRQTQEESRQTAETTRQTQESTRQTKEGERQTAEEGRATAESGRVSAEESRVAAETAREEQAQSDHTRAEGDHARAEEDHERIADKADVDGYYSGMTVGLAENLIDTKGTGTEQTFVKRTSCGDQSIADDGAAIVQRFFGKSFVWNQLVQNGNFADGTTGWLATNNYGTLSASNNELTYTVVTTTATKCLENNAQLPVSGHKYFCSLDVKFNNHIPSTTGNNRFAFGIGAGYVYGDNFTIGEYKTLRGIISASNAVTNFSVFPRTSSNGVVGDTINFRNIFCIDLTLMFGVGNEPTSVEEFEAWLRNNIGVAPYYGYTLGTLTANKVAGIRTIGFNRYNHATGNAELVKYDNGGNPMYQITGEYTALSFTDALGNTITPEVDAEGYFDIPEDGVLSVTGGNDTDTCVHLCWSGYRDGEYEKYWEESRVKELTELKGKLNGAGESVVVFPDGLKSAGSVRDEIVGNKAIKRVGVVDLGALDWLGSNGQFHIAQIPFSLKLPALNNIAMNAICQKYTVIAYQGSNGKDKVIFTSWEVAQAKWVWIYDSAYTDATTFKSAMDGVLLYYELAEPEEYILDEPFNTTYKVADFGTEEIIPSGLDANLLPQTAPFTAIVKYNDDFTREIVKLPQNYVRSERVKQVPGNSETDILSQKAVEDNYAHKSGYEPGLGVGAADNITGKSNTEAVYRRRTAGGTADIGSGAAAIARMKGRTMVWNQLARNGNFAEGGNTPTSWFIGYNTVVDNSNSAYIEFNREDGDASLRLPAAEPLVYGHKYLVSCRFRRKEAGEGTCYVYCAPLFEGRTKSCPTDGSWYYLKEIYTENNTQIDGTDSTYGAFKFLSSVPCQIDKKVGVNLFDLTLMFGAGNEPETVAEFEAMFPLPYYDYSEPKLVSNKAEAIKTVGFNQWDGEASETDKYLDQNGGLGASVSYVVSSYIPVFGKTNYYFKDCIPSSGANACLCWYDVNKNFISSVRGATNINGKIIESPNNAAYLRCSIGKANIDTCCINLSWSGYRNGEYEPYWESVLPLNLAQITGKLNGEGESVVIFPDGLRSAGTVFDELVVDSDGVARKAIKRIGNVDLGALTWQYSATTSFQRFVSSALTNIKKSGYMTNIRCSKYLTDTAPIAQSDIDKTICCSSQGTALVVDHAYTDAATFKAAMDGVILYYEMAVYEEYILDTPIAMNYRVDDFGTEERLPADTAESVLPEIDYDVKYSINARDTLRNLSAAHKRGVIKQTQNWTGTSVAGYDYTISNVEYGKIPTASIKLFVAAGAVFNEETGYFELNGLTDISFDEMTAIYALWQKHLSNNCYYKTPIRTNLPFSSIDFRHQDSTRKIILGVFYQTQCEVILWIDYNYQTYVTDCAYNNTIIYSNRVKKILGEIKCGNGAINNAAFGSPSLEEIQLKLLNTNLPMERCPRLSLASVVYAVQNANNGTTAITITLHATAYARCVADTTEYTYNEQTYTGIIALAAAKNITIQSA